ncbi:MAG: ribose-phosphate pyrophosphokinase [Bacteroidales bacterium]|nr:ribose-phosphate pyrophosphokinase [Bacteroidales bacterium]
MQHEHRMLVFSCKASEAFAREVVKYLQDTGGADGEHIELGALEVDKFSDGEFQPSYRDSVRGATVFLIQSTFPPADNLMELLLCIDAAKRASADKVIAVIPYFGWARQDRKDRPRVSIGAKLVANLLRAAGADRVMTCDLHADQIQGFFDIPVDHIYASGVFVKAISESMKFKDLAIAAPDMGGAKRANAYSKFFSQRRDCPVIICHKTRERANVVAEIKAIGDADGKDVVIVDDMIDTAGTLCKAADVLKKLGAKTVRACASHGVLSGNAIQRIEDSALDEVFITDTIPHPELDPNGKITVLSIAPVFANIMRRVYMYEPVSPEFEIK